MKVLPVVLTGACLFYLMVMMCTEVQSGEFGLLIWSKLCKELELQMLEQFKLTNVYNMRAYWSKPMQD